MSALDLQLHDRGRVASGSYVSRSQADSTRGSPFRSMSRSSPTGQAETTFGSRFDLPALPLEDWEPTLDTLHLWAQIVGKVPLAAAAPRNHWWHVTLYVDVRGLTTRRMHAPSGITFQIDFDFVDHRLVVRTAGGDVESFPLVDGLSVAEFDANLHELLGKVGTDVAIRELPYGMDVATPFQEDREHASYDADAVTRFWRILDWADGVFEEFAGWSCAKTSPVHLFWHGLDLAVTRFSGRRAPENRSFDPVSREAYTHEVVSFGFWAGDQKVREPTFYSYTAPEPPELRGRPLRPDAARWTGERSAMALLPYESVRTASDPRATLLSFLESAYCGGSDLAEWDREDLTSSWCPEPAALRDLLGEVN